MDAKKTIPVLLIGGAAAYYFYNKIRGGLNTLSFKIGKVTFNRAATAASGYLKIVLNIGAEVNNPGDIQATIKGGDIQIIANNKIVANVDNIGSTVITAKTKKIVFITVGVNTLSVVPTISDVINLVGKGAPINILVRGTVKTNLGDIKINESRTVTL